MSEPIQSIAQNNYILQSTPSTATMFTTELEYDGDKISGYAGSAFKAGTDLEFGYDSADNISAINNSALTDVNLNNIVQTNSGAWGGSALPISAGPGINVQLENDTLVFSTVPNETVLFNGERYLSATGPFTLSENPYNFEKIQLWGRTLGEQKTTLGATIMPNADNKTYTDVSFIGVQYNLNFVYFDVARFDINSTGFNIESQKQFMFNTGEMSTYGAKTVIVKVIGINRIAGGN